MNGRDKGAASLGSIGRTENDAPDRTSLQLPVVPQGVPAWAWAKIARAEGGRWAIAERDASGEVIGTAFRDADGGKTFAPGGKRGLIVAWPLDPYAGSTSGLPVYVCEGASDTAALLGLDMDAVGVPMAGHCGRMLADLLAERHAVIVADSDDAGRRGAAKIADALLARCRSVRIIEPPGGAKDARAAVIAGADARAFANLADKADADTMTPDAPAVPAFAPFPVDALPEPIRSHVVAVAERMDTDPILVIQPALAMFAGAVGNAVRVVVRDGWIEPLCLWTGVLAMPGSMKTQTQDAATGPMHDAQRAADAEYDARMREYDAAHAQWDAERKQAKGVPKPDEPIRKQWMVGDTTPEALAHILKGNARGVTSLHDELGGLFGGFGRYAKSAGGSEAAAAFYKSAFNAKTYTENRKGETGKGRYIRIEAPLVSIAGGIQPERFREIVTRQYVEDGLASRFLWAWPPDRPGGWVDEGPSDPAPSAAYAAAYARLSAIPLNVAPDGKLTPAYVGLSRPTQALARTWVNALRERIGDAPDNAVRAAMAKLKGVAFRLALLFHLADWAGCGGAGEFGAISPDTLRRALTTADWYAAEAVRVYGLHGETAAQADTRRLVEWIERKGGTATARDLTHGLRAYRGDPDAAGRALSALVQANFGLWEADAHGPKGGRPARRFRLVSTVTVTETPANTGKDVGYGDGDTGDTATDAGDGWGEL